ncbi:MAG TPA: AAA family ATPase [Candidatus Paceibacterota bacterium]
MYLANIKLWNFRKYGKPTDFNLDSPDLDLNLTKGLNVLIGENDSGKSAIIDAIKLTLKTHSFDWIRAEQDDFFGNSSRFRIELMFIDLNLQEAKNFIDWLGWTGEGEDAQCFLRLILDVKRSAGSEQVFPYDIKAGVDTEGVTLNAEARDYLKSTYLRPLRDAESELVPKKNSRLSQILQGHDAFKGKKDDHLLIEIFKHFNTSIEKYFEGKDTDDVAIGDLKGQDLKNEIDKYIQSFYHPDRESVFTVNDGKLKNILERLELSLKGVINPGLGTLNKLFMSSELLHLNKPNWNGLRLGLIEELEAHLHPQAQMQVIEVLQAQKDIQLILTTHSPNLASKVKLKHLIVCKDGAAFPMGSEYTKLDQKEYVFLEKFLDTTKANLFFAKGVILVEGWAEEILIPSIAKKMGIDLTEKGVTVINIGNLGFSNYTNIFLRQSGSPMNIPVAVVTDVDVPRYQKDLVLDGDGKPVKVAGKNQYEFAKIDTATVEAETIAKIPTIEARSEENVKFFVAPQWTLEYSLLNSSCLSDSFKMVVEAIHTGTNWTDDFEKSLAEKLINKGLKKTEIAYKLANLLDKNFQNTTSLVTINKDDEADTISYLIKAIRYASNS